MGWCDTSTDPYDLSWEATSLPVSGWNELSHSALSTLWLPWLLRRSGSMWYLVLPQWFSCFSLPERNLRFVVTHWTEATVYSIWALCANCMFPLEQFNTESLKKLLLYDWNCKACFTSGHTPISDVTAGVLPLWMMENTCCDITDWIVAQRAVCSSSFLPCVIHCGFRWKHWLWTLNGLKVILIESHIISNYPDKWSDITCWHVWVQLFIVEPLSQE